VQVDTDPIPNVIVDVRKPDEVAYNPLPQDLMGGVNIPGILLLALDYPLLSYLLQVHWQSAHAAHVCALKWGVPHSKTLSALHWR
jgi:hypothetical protein